jgi:hypothetical protein
LYVTTRPPVESGSLPSSDAFTPCAATALAPFRRKSGGQIRAQVAWHVTRERLSGTNMYSVLPAPFTRILPSPGTVRAETTTRACDVCALDRAPTAAETPVTSTIAVASASTVGSLLTRISYETS